MALKAKIPLIMNNDVKVRTISELKENFDVERVLGYFIDGKLQQWLEDRCYEEETEAIIQLEKDDIDIAKKICDIFDVEYTNEKFDVDEIAIRNERIAKLKQFTSDDEIISNVDAVAFNQEELADLYNIGIQKIYLCEGDFVIPKSKCALEYVFIANPRVEGLFVEEESVKEEKIEKDCYVYDIPLKIADKIGINPYVDTKDYLVYRDPEFNYYKYNKTTNKEENLEVPEHYKKVPFDYAFYVGENIFMFVQSDINYGDFLVYDIDNSSYYEINVRSNNRCIRFRNERFVSEGKLAYFDNDDIKIVDIKTGETEFCTETCEENIRSIILYKQKLFVYDSESNGRLSYFETNNYMNEQELLKYGGNECMIEDVMFHPYNGSLFMIHYQPWFKTDPRGYGFKVIKINVESDKCTTDVILDLTGENIDFDDYLRGTKDTQYIPFVKLDENHSLYLLNLKTNEVTKVATECGFHGQNAYGEREFGNDRQVVNNYVYYLKGKKKRLYRVNLTTGQAQPLE